MATGTVRPSTVPPPPPVPAGHVEHERVIKRQLGRTTWHLRLVDLFSGLAAWAIAVIAFLFLAALVDHWIGLGTFGRLAALTILASGSLYYLLLHIGPLLVRSINPTYAARTIEEATPSLKNSLINFLQLKNDRQGIKEIVFQAVERQAASDIAVVPVEAAVDRSRLFHAGYVLCGVMAVFAAYKILSPKDPFQSVARVLAPWADIARPSRVHISDVQPGSAEVYLGQTQKISAIISGNRDDDTIVLRYTTTDGQTVDQPVEMALAAGGLRHECVLPPPETGSFVPAGGLLQNVTYRIVAGDAESSLFRLTVVSAPTIIVDRLQYEFPPYTKKPAETVNQQGDIRALEGTKVTIHAIANQPIKSAWIEFDPAVDDSADKRVPLIADGSRASGTITLELKADRETPWRGAYQVRFYNDRNQRSQQPILHKIDVIRDLAPEVQILHPQRLRIEVPEDGEQTIEVRAVDPDFGLSRLRIEGTLADQPTVAIDLLQPESGQPPQATVPYMFRPRQHKLKAGDELTYMAVAEDNRTSSQTGQPEPNVARTRPYTLVVLPPQQTEGGKGDALKPPMPGDNPPPGANENQPDKQPPGKRQPDKQQPRQPEGAKQQPMDPEAGKGEQQPGKAQSKEPQKNKPQQGDQQKGGPKSKGGNQGKNDQKQKGDEQKGDQRQGDQKQGDQKQGDQKQGEQQQGGQQKGKQQEGQQQDGQQQDGQQQNGGQAGGQQKQQPDGQQSGAEGGKNAEGAPQQENPMNGGQPSGNSKQPAGQQGDPSADAQGQPNGSGENQGKAHDGRAIEELLKELEKKGEKPPQGGNQQQPGQEGQRQEGQQDPAGQQPQQKGEPGGDQKGNQQDSAQQGSNQAGSQPQSAGKSGGKAQETPATGNPAGNDQKLDPIGQDKQGDDKQGKGKQGEEQQGKAGERMPDDKQGQNPSTQKSDGNKGGAPLGPEKTDKAEPSPKQGGEKRDPGAAKNGDEGAGSESKDKSGSGEGTQPNRDKPKEQKSDSKTPEEGDPGTPSNSKKQSDSKGAMSGDESGGGKKGPGQSAKAKGNDSAGSQSAADQGAGKAEESGKGEMGDKAGDKQKADGKTGQAGTEAGKGSTSKAAQEGQEGGAKGGQPKGEQPQGAEQQGKQSPSDQGEKGEKGAKGESGQPQSAGQQPQAGQNQPDQSQPGQKPSSDPANQGQGKGGGYQPSGGGDGQANPMNPQQSEDVGVADAANLEYARKATEMVLQRLKDAEHNPDPELLDKLGWTREDLAEFIRRWDALQKSAAENQDGKRELDEALKSLGLRDPAQRKRTGGQARDNQRDLRDAGNRTAPPSRYRDLFDAFRKGAARSRE